MRIIPGNTKVKIEIFKGLTLWDILVCAISCIMLALIAVSTLPFKKVFLVMHLFITVLLMLRVDKDANYMYLINIIRHYGYKRRFNRIDTDKVLLDYSDRGDVAVTLDELFPDSKKESEKKDKSAEDDILREEPAEEAHIETKKERKERLKREKAEYKADTKLLKSKLLSKEEEDAIWLKRANQSKANKESKKASKKTKKKSNQSWAEIEEISAFSGIKDGYIEYAHGKYYGVAVEIPCVEFKFFSNARRSMAIDYALGGVIRSIRSDYGINIVKIERSVSYDSYIGNEAQKLDDLRGSYEQGFIKEDELKARVAIVYDRIYALQALRDNNKVVIPFYYIVFFDSDKKQLENTVRSAMDQLKQGEMQPRRLKTDKEVAVFLKYSNTLDFDETEIDRINPEYYAKWAMPEKVEFTPRNAVVNGIATHNFRISNYPTTVYDAWLASVLTYPSTKVVLKMRPMDSGKAIRSIDKSLAELRAKVASAHTDSEAMQANTHLETLQLLLNTLQSESETLLNVNAYVTAYDIMYTQENPNFDKLEKESFLCRISSMKKTVKRIWKESGFTLNANEFNQARAYIGSQISGYDPMAGDGRGIPSNTIAATFPWVFPHIMDEKGVQLGNSDGVPVFVDFFVRNSERVNSNMVIVGKSGSGKSFATKTLLSNLAADDSKIFILDPEDEYSALAKNLNGKFINVGNAKYGRLNPFHIITTLDDDESEGTATSSYATHLQFLEEFFKQILPDCDKDSLEYLNSLVDRVYATKGITPTTELSKLRPSDYPIFDDLYDEILREFQRTDNEYIKTMLRTLMNYISKFSEGGRNSVIWNGPSTVTTEENFTVFNFQSLLANRNSTIANAQMLLVLKYIDNEIIKNRDYNEKYNLNRKIVVVIDEAHVFIDTKFPVALDFMFQLAKRIRKYNGMQIVITQNIKDFVGSEEIARKSTAIINACQYSFIFSLAPNDMDDLCKLYEKAGGINESEQEQIIQAQRGQAFVVMSPTSRTSFKVTVPDDVRKMFSKPNFVNKYFEGNGGDTYWENFIKDSTEKRIANLEARGIHIESPESGDAAKPLISFDEISDGEFNLDSIAIESADDILSSIEVTEPEKEEASISGLGISFKELDEDDASDQDELIALKQQLAPQTMLAEENILPEPVETTVLPAAEPVVSTASAKTEEILAGLVEKLGTANMVEEIKRAVREEVEKEMKMRAPLAPQLQPAVQFAGSTSAAQPAEAESAVSLFGEAPASSEPADMSVSLFGETSAAPAYPKEDADSSVDEAIFDLFGLDDDKKEDDEIFDKFDLFKTSSEEEAGGSEDTGTVLGSIFDFADLSELDNYEEPESSIGADEDDDDYDSESDSDSEDSDDNFDIMSFLAQQADEAEEDENGAVIEDFINGSETKLDVSLEQLIAYNRKKSKK